MNGNHLSSPMLGLRTAVYKVGDLAAAKTWYAEAFGVEPYFDTPFYVGFNPAGYELGLMPDTAGATGKTDNVLCYWGVEDIERQVQRLVALGARVQRAPTDVGEGIRVAELRDPWDNVIGLIYNPHFNLPTAHMGEDKNAGA